MTRINKHLYNDLFIEKKVRCDQQMYRLLYSEIWPCEKYFKCFLVANDTSVKIKYAKKIFYFFNSINDFILPNFLIDELISIQQYNLQKNTAYIPQDHLIHSINLYILGIYVFFNIEVFNRKILKELNNNSHIDRVIYFIKQWKLFSLYHDIGYVLEGYVNEKGVMHNQKSIERYNELYNVLIHKCTIQAIAKLILNIHIIKQSNKKIKISQFEFKDEDWIFNSKIITDSFLKEQLEECKDFIQLEYINCQKDYQFISWLLKNNSYLIMYEDNYGNPLAFLHKKIDGITKVFHKPIIDVQNLNLLYYDPLNLEKNGVICKYYVGNLEEKIKSVVPRQYKDEVLEYYECLPNEIKNKISLVSNPNAVEYIYNSIYECLSQKINFNDIFLENIDLTSNKTAVKKALISVFEKKIEVSVSKILNSNTTTEEKISLLINSLKEISSHEVDSKTRLYYNEKYGTTMPIIYFYRDFYNKVTKQFKKPTNFIRITNHNIKISPFVYDKNSEIAPKIHENLRINAEKLKINFQDLKNYQTEYSICDHGVISASILFQILSFHEALIHVQTKVPLILLAFSDQDTIESISIDKRIASYSKVLFSILLHNIYTKESKSYGINYKHDIDTDAFSFFCAFMDALQTWGRPKQLDFSVTDLPKEHFLENDFDIALSEHSISIICSTESTGNMRKRINELEQYLPGVSHIIKLQETEL